MGAEVFMEYGSGKTPQEAFDDLVSQAQHDMGHGGYTGTIAEKGEFVMIEPPSNWKGDAQSYADHLLDIGDRRISDKWGPAGCILLDSVGVVGTEQVPYATTSEKYKQEGARKWKTVYVIRSQNDARYYRREDSFTAAESVAKEYAKAHNETMVVSIEKILENGQQEILTVRPKTKAVKTQETENQYLFFGWASS